MLQTEVRGAQHRKVEQIVVGEGCRGEKIGKDAFSTGCVISEITPVDVPRDLMGKTINFKTFKIIYIDKNHEFPYIIEPK